MRGMGGMPDGAMRGMGGMQRQPMGSGIETGERRTKKPQGLRLIDRQADGPVVAQQVGDLILAVIRRQQSVGTSLATGWTLVKNATSGSTIGLLVAYKFATTIEPEDPAWGSFNSREYLTFRGADSVGASVIYNNGGTATTFSQFSAIPGFVGINSFIAGFSYNKITTLPNGYQFMLDSEKSAITSARAEASGVASYSQTIDVAIAMSVSVELISAA